MITANEDRVLVFGMSGGDAALTTEILSKGGFEVAHCPDLGALLASLAEGAGALLVTQEALGEEVPKAVADALAGQPPWSDLPVIVSVLEEEYETPLALSERVNVVTLQRPVRVRALLGVVGSALRARRRQYATRDVLERLERTTADLRVLEEEMRTVVENLPALAWTARADGHITFYNQRWYRYTGTTFEDMEGWGWQKVHAPEMLAAVTSRWERSLQTGEPFEMEFPIRGADGGFRWFLTRVTPLRDRTGQLTRWVGVNVDVDDKRRIAEERERFSKRTALLARAGELLSASFDIGQGLAALAEALAEWMGTMVTIDVAGETGAWAGAAVHVDGHRVLRGGEAQRGRPDGVRALVRRAEASGKAFVASSEADRAAIGCTSAIAAPLIVRGEVVGALVIGAAEGVYGAEDLLLVEQVVTRAAVAIDNARLFEEAQRDRTRIGRLQSLAAAFSAARTTTEVADVAMTDGAEAAGAQRGLVGVLAEGDTVLDVIRMRGPVETVARWRKIPMTMSAPLTDAVRTGEPAFYATPEDVARSFPHLADARSPGDSALAVLPLTVGGRTFGALGLVYDDPRTFPESDRTQALALARLCAQAMDRAFLFELAQRERLRAEEANRTKDEFLAVVSHELRTPLNAMLGWTRMLRSGRLEAERHERALETIERNAVAQTQLVEDLLDITRIVTGKLRLSIDQVDLARVVDAAIETVGPAAEARGVRVERRLEPLDHPFRGDPERLQQIVWNLLSNAVKFTPRGGGVVVRVYGDATSTSIDVEDTGVGIAPEFLPHVFERFRQAEGGTTRSYGGLGLGLAIVKHLVELHGGTIAAQSDGVGKGTRFRVRLPLAARVTSPAPLGPPRAPPDVPGGLEGPVQELRGLRVLVVEDEADARDLLVALLEQRAVDVRAAASAAEGLRHLASWTPDVILSDIGMPVEDGYSFIQQVRAMPRDRGGKTPAVALTAYARTEDRRRAMLAGFDMHLAKPIDPEELTLVLARLGRLELGASS